MELKDEAWWQNYKPKYKKEGMIKKTDWPKRSNKDVTGPNGYSLGTHNASESCLLVREAVC